jgi:protein tyrosine/serine phosphatase
MILDYKDSTIFKKLALILFFLILLSSLVFLFFHCDENFHPVIAGQIYRSGQLTHNELIEKIQDNHLNSVINLRGENKADDWYDTEATTLQTIHIPLYNVRLSSYDLPSKELLLQLVRVIEVAPKPTLIHCASGADRTGLASAIVILLNNGSIDQAEKQVSWRYGAIRAKSAGKLFFKEYIEWLNLHRIKHPTADTLKAWLTGDSNQHESL